MCIKCGCGKKKGEKGFGMGPAKTTKKAAPAKKMGKKK